MGGLVGKKSETNATVNDSYWDTEASGKVVSDGGEGRTTVQMNEKTTYEDWDFTDTWRIKADENDGYPYLKWTDPPSAEPEFAGGDGTVDNPYLVATPAHLNNVRLYLDKHFKQIANIDLNVAPYKDSGWTPIGSSGDPFTGTFDGDGFTTSNLYIHLDTENYVGLFGCTGQDVSILNVRLPDVNVNGQFQVGSLVGENNGSVTACCTTGQVFGSEDVGGLVGRNNGTITRSYAAATVTGQWYVGGLIGENRDKVIDSYAMGDVTGNKYGGGLAGSNWGIAGKNATIVRCYSAGAVSGKTPEATDLGGLVGKAVHGSVERSYWDTATSGQNTSDGGEGKVTAQMKDQATYDGWDFANAWNIDAAKNDGYPFLREVIEVDLDTEPPMWSEGFPKAVGATTSGVTLQAKIDEAGTVYYVILARGADAVTSEQVKNGQNGQGEAVAAGMRGSSVLTADSEKSISVSGLATSTSYDIYVVAEDAAGNLQSEPRKLEATTQAAELTPNEAIQADLDALTWEIIRGSNSAQDNVKYSLNLITSGANGTSITWSASPNDPVRIDTATGAVNRPAHGSGNVQVNLTATVSKTGGQSLTKEFVLTVVELPGGGSKVTQYTITATAGTGGTISPKGNISVKKGGRETFTITPNDGYIILDVKIDSKSIGAVETYTFKNVNDNHTIKATFEKEKPKTDIGEEGKQSPDTGVWDNPFIDVSQHDWHYEVIMGICQKGLMNEYAQINSAPGSILPGR